MDFRTEQPNRIYCADTEGHCIAEITFPETEPGVCCITHTFVDDSLRGQGIAGKLVRLAVEQIQTAGCRVTASCSYAKRWLEQHPDLQETAP